MSGFERILARVSGDALRDYCSSAIEDELKNLKNKMQSCLSAVEKAVEVQEAIAKLSVPLDGNASALMAIQKQYKEFSDDLDKFVKDQRKAHDTTKGKSPKKDSQKKATADEPATPSHKDKHSGDAEEETQKTPAEQISHLLGKIQHRLTKKRNTTWIVKNTADIHTINKLARSSPPQKSGRNEIIVVLDHYVSAVALSPLATDELLHQLRSALLALTGIHPDLDEFIHTSERVLANRNTPAPPPSTHSTTPSSPAKRRSPVTSSDSTSSAKKRKVDAPASDFTVKVEAVARASSTPVTAPSQYEVFITNLPWSVCKEELESYFGVAGRVASVRIPLMDDMPFGAAFVAFTNPDAMDTALRMDGYDFQGSRIKVSIPRSNRP